MPRIPSTYKPPFPFTHGHFATIYAGKFRRVKSPVQHRQRLELPDGDFLDMDWSHAPLPTQKVVVLIHGLEGDAQRPYITGSAKILNAAGYDCCALNLRGCSGSPNRLFRSYHSGATEDLAAVVEAIRATHRYAHLYLKGFSLGGNLVLKYLGERPAPAIIKAAVAVSTPCDLYSSLRELLKPKNRVYAARFRRHLVAKLRHKQHAFPDRIDEADIRAIRTLKDFDDIYTSRAHGFADALDYYQKSSSLPFLPQITVPTLVLNARDDSFLGPECYPYAAADRNPALHLEIPDFGGHVGFFGIREGTYSEKRALMFLNHYQ